MLRQQTLLRWALALVLVPALAPAQVHTAREKIEIRAVSVLPQVVQDDVPILRKLAARGVPLSPSDLSNARAVIQAAAKNWGYLLVRPPAEPDGVVSVVVDQNEDVLVARWNEEPNPDWVVPVLLWDDSVSYTIVFQCPANRLTSKAALRLLVDGLFRWNSIDVGSAGMCLRPRTSDGLVMVGYIYRSYSNIPRMVEPLPLALHGFVRGRTGYLAVRQVTDRFFPDTLKHIDERFPPLVERLPAWPTARLIAAIGKTRRAAEIWGRSYQRDRLLVRELAKRDDLTLDIFNSLLQKGAGNFPMADVPELISAAVQAKRVGRFAPAILQYLDAHVPTFYGYGGSGRVLDLLTSEPDIDLEDHAILCLQRGAAIPHSLAYLGARGRSQRARDAVATVQDPQWYKPRDQALTAIDARRGSAPSSPGR